MSRPLSRLPLRTLVLGTLLTSACTVVYHRTDDPSEFPQARVIPGITNLLRDSIGFVQGKRVALLTNAAAVDEGGRRDIDVLRSDSRAKKANVQLVTILTPEHGLDVNLDRPGIASGTDRASGIPVVSMYGSETQPPPDATLAAADVIVIDLPDVGSRTWTYEGAMLYTLRAAARVHKPVVVLDRPNPITGSIVEGPVLDSALANPDDPAPGHPGLAWAAAPIPLRHGMTAAELARYYNGELGIHAELHVVPISRWSRELWFDRTGLPFVAPSPNLRSFHSVLLYTGLVPFEATNLSVGRGLPDAFQHIGAPWMDPARVKASLADARIRGVRLTPETFTPVNPTDGKYANTQVHGFRIEVTERQELQSPRLTALLLAAIHKAYPTQLTIDTLRFDRLFGSSAARRAIIGGEDPDAVADRTFGPAYAFRERVRKYLLY